LSKPAGWVGGYTGPLVFATANSDEYWAYAANLGVELTRLPDIVIIDPVKSHHYTWSHNNKPSPTREGALGLDSGGEGPPTLTADGVNAFVDDFLAGSLGEPRRHVNRPRAGDLDKPAPSGRGGGSVFGAWAVDHPGYHLQSSLRDQKEFIGATTGREGDVLVYFHASWCGFCSAFSTTWLHIAALNEAELSSGRLRMVSFDMQRNEAPAGVTLTSLPTLLLFKGGGGEEEAAGVRHLGPHSVEGVQGFLKETCGVAHQLVQTAGGGGGGAGGKTEL